MAALRHPLRRTILEELAGGRTVGSPRELADDLGAPLSNVSYHFRVLAECDAIDLVRTRQVRGSVQHFYRPAKKFMEDPTVTAVLGLPT
ncbi:MAG TPA: helix-turn-helix domain-containing protein [Solirubrobacterales bacterium]